MTKLADEIHAIPPEVINGKPRCKVGAFVTGLDADDAAAVDELLNSAVSTDAIVSLLRQHGAGFSNTTVKQHRAKRCGCYRG